MSMPSERGPRRRGSWLRRAAQRLADAGASVSLPVLLLAVVLMGAPGVFVMWPPPTLPADTQVLSRHGHLIALVYGSENRIPVASAAIPPVMRNAIVAIEDDTYWEEPGVDPVGIARALLVDVTSGRILQGGSTLTQQLAKNLYLSDQRTIPRKLKELAITLKMGMQYSKGQILTMYLNDVYFGEGSYGVQAASQTYFGHGIAQLTLPEAALLAGLVNAPSALDPYYHPSAARARRNQVLARMAALHYITPAAARAAAATPVVLARAVPPDGSTAPYFIQFMRSQLAELDPTAAKKFLGGGYKIVTTLNRQAQAAANRAMANDMPPVTGTYQGAAQPEGAVVGLNPASGSIEAMVGGRAFATSTFNRAVYAYRQPGSAFKYFLYTAAISAGYPTSTVKVSGPVSFPNGHGGVYTPHNFGHVFAGPLTMRQAIAESDDIVALKWMAALTPPRVIALAKKMGITSPMANNLTTALGSSSVSPLEMASAVAPLANGGFHITPRSIISVQDSSGAYLVRTHPERYRVLTPAVTYVVDQLFAAPLTSPKGTAHNLTRIFSRPADAKTGTSSQQRDAWLVGFTPQLVGVAWTGNDQDTPMGLTGDRGAGPVWAAFMHGALAGQPVKTFPQPPGVVWRQVCVHSGLLANGCCTSYREVFLVHHLPKRAPAGTCGGRAGGPPTSPKAAPAPRDGQTHSLWDRILRAIIP